MEKNQRIPKKICLASSEANAAENPANINRTSEILNDDCLLEIFQYLPICDRVRLERVNKRWCAMSRMSWTSLKTLTFTNDFWGCLNNTKITTEALRKVLHLCGRFLKELDMSETPVLAEDIDISPLLKFCPNLTTVDFTSVIAGDPLITSLVESCKNVDVLRIEPIDVSPKVLNSTILETYTSLRVLNIGLTSFLRGFLEFKNSDSIEELYFEYCDLNINDLDTSIPQLENLHTLSLRGSLDMIKHSGDFDFIDLSNIRTLDISDNFLDDNDMIQIGNALTHLTRLNISENWDVTDTGLSVVISASNLEYLDIDEMNITGSCLSNLPHLKKLSCQYCQHLNAEHLQYLFNTSSKLESFDLGGVNEVGSIIKAAIESVKYRNNDFTLSMFVNATDLDITDWPENLALFEYESDEL